MPSRSRNHRIRNLVAWTLFCAGAVVGCKSHLVDRGTYVADVSRRAHGHDPRVRYLVLHYTVDDDARALRALTGRSVSSHYLVLHEPFKREGQPLDKPFVYALVPENERAWHAGPSHWQRASDLNDSSIGIEIVNRGPLDPQRQTWERFDDAQIDAVIRLSRDIIRRHAIPPHRVVGHADIAPQRKEDPGPAFPWERLAREGVGAWPDPGDVAGFLAGRDPKAPADLCMLQYRLSTYGYDVPVDGTLDARTRRVLQAFQMHFRARDYAGDPDAETDALVSALLDKYVKRGAAFPEASAPPPCRSEAPPIDGGAPADGSSAIDGGG